MIHFLPEPTCRLLSVWQRIKGWWKGEPKGPKGTGRGLDREYDLEVAEPLEFKGLKK